MMVSLSEQVICFTSYLHFYRCFQEFITFFPFSEEIPATQSSTESDKETNYYSLNSQIPSSQCEERQRIIDSAPYNERYSQKIFDKFQVVPKPRTFPPQKPISEQQKGLLENFNRSMIVRKEVDYTLYNPNVKIERQKDETPEAVKKLCLEKKIVKASEVYKVMTQSQMIPAVKDTEDLGPEAWSQLRKIESEEKKKKKVIQWENFPSSSSKPVSKVQIQAKLNPVKQLVVNTVVKLDFDDFDNETLTVIQEQQLLNESLGSLSQILSTSEILAGFIENKLSTGSNLDVSRVDLKKTLEDAAVSEEEVDHDVKKDLDSAFLKDDEVIGNSGDEEPTGLKKTYTEQLEENFLRQTQFESQPPKKTVEKSFRSTHIDRIDGNLKKVHSRVNGKLNIKSGAFLKTESYDKSFSISGIASTSGNASSSGFATSSGTFSGFSFASGKKATVKESTLKKITNAIIKEDQRIEKELVGLAPLKIADQKPSLVGFGLASEKPVKNQEKTLNRVKNTFEIEDKKLDKEKKVKREETDEEFEERILSRRRPIDCPEWLDSGVKQQKLIKESHYSYLQTLKAHRNQPQTSGSVKTLVMTPAFPSLTPRNSGNFPATPETSGHSKTAGTSRILGASRTSKIPPATSRNSSNFPATPGTSRSSSVVPRTLVTSKPVKPSSATSSLALKLASFAQSTANFSGFTTLSGKKVNISEKNMKRFAQDFENEEEKIKQEVEDGESFTTPGKPLTKKPRMEFGNSPVASSLFMKGVNQHSTPLIPRRKITDSQEVSSILQLCSGLDDSSETIDDFRPSSPKRAKFSKKLLPEFDESDESFGLDEIESIEREHKNYFTIAEDVKKDRKNAIEDQQKFVRQKADGDRAQMAGSVFMVKSSKNRKKLSEIVKRKSPANLSRHYITSKTAINFKFSMENHVSEEIWKKNTDGILMGDNARLILGETSKIGIDEIKYSFLASPGVDPKLVSDRWVENVFKMLVLKFSWLENSFQVFEQFDLLKPENLLLQMKYRYDREIDRHQRSALKKIVELDDVPCRRMVLKVVDVIDVAGTGYELELTDGWYSIRATIDAVLADACLREKIKVGTKLIISCAELIGCQGFDPLEMPENVRLKIHANSTRCTTWDHKMGFCKNPNPITIKVDSVAAMGGVVGRLQVIVVHVYPMIFVDGSGDKREFRSEKLHNRMRNKLDTLNFELHQRIVDTIIKEEMQELCARAKELKKSRTSVDKMSVEDICDTLEAEDSEEATYILGNMSQSLQKNVQTMRDKRKQELNEKIRKKFVESIGKEKQLLKFRVVDAANPGKSAMVSWWSPLEELLDIVKPGNHLEIVNTTAGASGQEIQVIAGTSTNVKLKQKKKISQNFYRVDTKIDEIKVNFKPANNEFDISCIVVRVDSEKTNNFIKVYVVDECSEVLCINFWQSLEDCAYDDVVVEGQVLHARNLQWRPTHAKEKIPQAFVSSDSTMFTTHPTIEIQKNRLEKLRKMLKDSKDFINEFKKKLGFEVSAKNKENHQNVVVQSPATPRRGPVFSTSLSNNQRFSPYSSTSKNTSASEVQKKRLGMSGPHYGSSPAPAKSNRTLPSSIRVQSYKQPVKQNRPVFQHTFKNSK